MMRAISSVSRGWMLRLVMGLAMLLLAAACGSPTPSPVPEPTPTAAGITYKVRLTVPEGFKLNIRETRVVLQIPNMPAFNGQIDTDGYALFALPLEAEGQAGMLIITSPDLPDEFRRSVFISRDTIFEDVPIPADALRSQDTQQATPNASGEQAQPAQPTDQPPAQPPSILVIEIPNDLTTVDMASLDALFSERNLVYSLTSTDDNQNMRALTAEGNGLTLLAINAVNYLGHRKLADPVPLDVINKYYKLAIGRKDGDNITLEEYGQLEKYGEAIYNAWKDYNKGDSETKTSFEQIIAPLGQ